MHSIPDGDSVAPARGHGDLEHFRHIVNTHGQVTLMLQNIACKFTKEDLRVILEDLGMRGKFAFVAVPRVQTRRANFGYAFVSFRSAEAALECCALCQGRVLGPSNTKKTCDVSAARVQGPLESVLVHRGQRDREAEILCCDDYLIQAQIDSAGAGGQAAASSSQAQGTGTLAHMQHVLLGPDVHVAPDTAEVPATALRSSVGAGSATSASAHAASEGQPSRVFTAEAFLVRPEDIFGDIEGLPAESLSCSGS